MRSVAVHFVTEDGSAEIVRFMHNVRTGEDRRYYTLSQVMSEPDLKDAVVRDALQQLNSWRKKYRLYKQLAGIAGDIEKYLEKIGFLDKPSPPPQRNPPRGRKKR
jgi:hypothetical protein